MTHDDHIAKHQAPLRLPGGEVCLSGEADIERQIIKKGLAAPRVTTDMVDAAIKSSTYYLFPGTTLMICALTLTNGFMVTGESACASLENFDLDLGETIAYQNARKKIWAYEGYLLRDKLSREV